MEFWERLTGSGFPGFSESFPHSLKTRLFEPESSASASSCGSEPPHPYEDPPAEAYTKTVSQEQAIRFFRSPTLNFGMMGPSTMKTRRRGSLHARRAEKLFNEWLPERSLGPRATWASGHAFSRVGFQKYSWPSDGAHPTRAIAVTLENVPQRVDNLGVHQNVR
jgi:hypothetical protein